MFSSIRYSVAAVNSRTYVQRERARKVARTGAAIETAALREVARRGYHALRMTDVARRAHVAPRTLYLHATSKERWRPKSEAPESILNELVALHDREYRVESVLLETLVDGALPRPVAAPLRDLDSVRLALITRTMNDLARRGALRVRAGDAIALAHALLSYPTWRTALTGPARRRAPRLVAAALRSAVL
jgi:AcrR family transcriptional regulator